jgi:hypothetical protein
MRPATRRFSIVALAALALTCGCQTSGNGSPPAPSDVVVAITVSRSAVTLDLAASVKLSAEARRADGTPIATVTITWSSSAAHIASVAGDGTVTAHTGGAAMITATAGGVSNSVSVTVRDIYDLDARSLPALVTAHYVDVGAIQRVSTFRSGIGHDYSDAVERCRSMKHYFMPRADVDWSTIAVSSPVNGTVVQLQQETTFGTQVQIRASALSAATVILFHVVVDGGISVGASVNAGQRLGRHVGSQTMSDVAIRIDTPSGFRLVSYFDAMTDSVFAAFQALGLASRATFVIPRGDRDASPLSCSGEQFANAGPLANWVDLR